jgi:hypothetical protein
MAKSNIKQCQKFIFLLSIALLFSPALVASPAFQITDVGTSADYIAVGGNEVGFYGGNNVFHNPSLMSKPNLSSISLFTTTLMGEINYKSIAISKSFDRFTFGLGYMDSETNGITETVEGSEEFLVSDYYGALFSIYKAGMSYKVSQKTTFGLSLSYYYNKIYSISASAMNADLGFSHQINRLLLTGSSKNIFRNNVVAYSDNTQEELPSIYNLAAKLDLTYIEPMMQYSFYRGKDSGYSVGIIIHHPKFSLLDLLVGYKSSYYLDELKHRWTFGLGLNIDLFTFNVTYEKSDTVAFDNNIYFSIKGTY